MPTKKKSLANLSIKSLFKAVRKSRSSYFVAEVQTPLESDEQAKSQDSSPSTTTNIQNNRYTAKLDQVPRKLTADDPDSLPYSGTKQDKEADGEFSLFLAFQRQIGYKEIEPQEPENSNSFDINPTGPRPFQSRHGSQSTLESASDSSDSGVSTLSWGGTLSPTSSLNESPKGAPTPKIIQTLPPVGSILPQTNHRTQHAAKSYNGTNFWTGSFREIRAGYGLESESDRSDNAIYDTIEPFPGTLSSQSSECSFRTALDSVIGNNITPFTAPRRSTFTDVLSSRRPSRSFSDDLFSTPPPAYSDILRQTASINSLRSSRYNSMAHRSNIDSEIESLTEQVKKMEQGDRLLAETLQQIEEETSVMARTVRQDMNEIEQMRLAELARIAAEDELLVKAIMQAEQEDLEVEQRQRERIRKEEREERERQNKMKRQKDNAEESCRKAVGVPIGVRRINPILGHLVEGNLNSVTPETLAMMKVVKQAFSKSLPRQPITKIEWINNPKLLAEFENTRATFWKQGRSMNELILFHGTAQRNIIP